MAREKFNGDQIKPKRKPNNKGKQYGKNNLIKEAHLAYQGGGSEKVYHIFLVKEKNDYVVN